MDPADVLIIAALVLGTALPIGLGSAWYHARRRARELEMRLRGGEYTSDERVEALERQMAALTEQLDQVASGQEFLARLVTRRVEQLPDVPPPRVTTPH